MSRLSDIDSLIEGYYDASLSEQEEQTLIALLFGQYADDKRYDAHRATLSFSIMGRRLKSHKVSAAHPRTFRISNYKRLIGTAASIAASVIVVLNIAFFSRANQDDCIMVRHGDKFYSSAEMAESEMIMALANVFEDCPSVEEELSNIFAELDM